MTDAWRSVPLSDLAEVATGKGIPREERLEDGPVPIFGANGVIGYTVEPMLAEPAVIVGRVGAYGAVNLGPVGSWVSDNALICSPRQNVPLKFLQALLETVDYDRLVHGTTQPLITQSGLRAYEVLVPPPDEQWRLADVLGALDERIAVASRLIGSLSAAAQVLTSMAPSTCTISELARTERVQWDPEQHSGDIVDHYSLPAFDVGAGAERVEASVIASNKLQIRGARVLFSRLNPDTNRTWLCIPSLEVSASVCSTEYAVLVAENTTVGQLWAVLSSGEVGDLLAAASTGTSASHQRVREDAVLGATVADPRSLSEADQRTIDAYADSVLEKVRELKALREARDFLLPRLVSGALRVLAAEKLVEAAT